MLDRIRSYIADMKKDEKRFGATVTGLLHLIFLIIALLYHVHFQVDTRPAYIEVAIGEYQEGTPAEFAEDEPEEVATQPDPSETEPDEPEPDVPEPEEEPEPEAEDAARPVDAPEQIEEIDSDPLETPDTEEIDPETQDQPQQEVVEAPPQAVEDEDISEGEETTGDESGFEGELDVEDGFGQDDERTSPYDLQWEGDFNRSPMVQPLPENTQDVEATIRVRFEVLPDGSVGRIIPVIRMNPELEREVVSTLRNWRFSRLPSGVPQESQWGTITFRFVFD